MPSAQHQHPATEVKSIPQPATVSDSEHATAKADDKPTGVSVVAPAAGHEAVSEHASPNPSPDPGVLGSAYQKAWASLGDDERQDLTADDGLRQLLVRLREADEKDMKESLLRRGIQAVAPFLGPVKLSLDFVGTFAEAEPIAATAVGIVKGVASVRCASTLWVGE